MPKRVIEDCTETQSKRAVNLDSKIANSYKGYIPDEQVSVIEEIDEPLSEIEVRDFFKRYVFGRRPCKIRFRDNWGFDWFSLRSKNILNKIRGDQLVQVEKKVDGGFGNDRNRIKILFKDFVDRLNSGGCEMYLTTQYLENDPDQGSECGGFHEEQDIISENSVNLEVENKNPVAEISVVYEHSQLEDNTEYGETFSTAIENFDSDEESIILDSHDDFEDLRDTSHIVTLSTGPLFETEAKQRLQELYQPPLTPLAGEIPIVPKFLSNLIPQQINLWIGSAFETTQDRFFIDHYDEKDPKLGFGMRVPGGGVSSGLHHDYADNIYISIEGRKRFTIFCPADTLKMYTVGEVESVLHTGIINYKRQDCAPLWRTLRDDGAIIAEVAAQRLELEADTLTEDDANQLHEIIKADSQKLNYSKFIDPTNFSTIPNAVLHLDKITDVVTSQKIKQQAKARWPLFEKAKRIYVDLQPGEMLWLPCGWFHEVTSFGDADNSSHVSLNYWIIPANGNTMEEPYNSKDRYWILDYERTKHSLSHLSTKD